MYLNPFKREEAEPLRQRRIWRYPRCDAKVASQGNNRTHMGASCDANFAANSNATPFAVFAANHSAALMPPSL